ncbi:MAG: hypothetical protein ACI4S2_12205, partial [Lachnospiraceae bacterium]
MSRLTNKCNDEIRNKAISIIRNLSTENGLSFEEKGVLSSFLVIERTENSKLKHYEDLEEQGRLAEIIRCKNCIRHSDECVEGAEGISWCDEHERLTDDDDYCSYAVG